MKNGICSFLKKSLVIIVLNMIGLNVSFAADYGIATGVGSTLPLYNVLPEENTIIDFTNITEALAKDQYLNLSTPNLNTTYNDILNMYVAEAFVSENIYSKTFINEKGFNYYYARDRYVTLVEYEDQIKTSGFEAGIYIEKDNKEMIVAFAGTAPPFDNETTIGHFVNDVLTDLMLLNYNEVPLQINDSISFVNKAIALRDLKYQGYEIIVTGHSLGGGLAQYVSLYTGFTAVTFNSAPAPVTPLTIEMLPVEAKAYCANCQLSYAFVYENKIVNIMSDQDEMTSFLEGIESYEHNSYDYDVEISKRFTGMIEKFDKAGYFKKIETGVDYYTVADNINQLISNWKYTPITSGIFNTVDSLAEADLGKAIVALSKRDYKKFIYYMKEAMNIPQSRKLDKLLYGDYRIVLPTGTGHSMLALLNKSYKDIYSNENLNAPIFVDLAKESTFYSSIESLVKMGVVHGYDDGTFRENNNTSQFEFLVMITRLIYSNKFEEFKNDEQNVALSDHEKYYKFLDEDVSLISNMEELNISNKDLLITRAKVAEIIVKLFGPNWKDWLDIPSETEIKRKINGCVYDWTDTTLRLYSLDIAHGFKEGCYRPNINISRGQITKVLLNTLYEYKEYLKYKEMLK